jgi:hypothetical protein
MYYPLWYISIFVFAGVFNLSFALMALYLRLRGGTERYTKSQLWALTLLAQLFFLNSFLSVTEIGTTTLVNQGIPHRSWAFNALMSNLVIYTAFILLSLGLVYPRPITKWSRLKWIVVGILALGLLFVLLDIIKEHISWDFFLYIDRLQFVYFFAIYIPVFIWLSEYSRQPNREARIIYTILIWGFLFVYITSNTNIYLGITLHDGYWIPALVVMVTLAILALIRLAVALWGHRKRWSYPEYAHLLLLLAAVGIGLITGLIGPYSGIIEGTPHIKHLAFFLAMTFGWIIVRPVLFSYGLLRYRLLGTQVKAERALAVLVTVIISTVFGLLILNIITKEPTTLTVAVAVLSGLVLLFPCWKISNRFLERLLVSNIEAQDLSMRERRNIYLMGLQTAVVHGVLEDEEDRQALKNLKEELAITDREHDLLMDGITLHEARLIPEKRVEGAYLIHTHGLLISSYKETKEEELDEEGTDSDIFAGMLTAITEFVDETGPLAPSHTDPRPWWWRGKAT